MSTEKNPKCDFVQLWKLRTDVKIDLLEDILCLRIGTLKNRLESAITIVVETS